MVKQVHHGRNLYMYMFFGPRVPLTELSLRAGCISNLRSTWCLKKLHIKTWKLLAYIRPIAPQSDHTSHWTQVLSLLSIIIELPFFIGRWGSLSVYGPKLLQKICRILTLSLKRELFFFFGKTVVR